MIKIFLAISIGLFALSASSSDMEANTAPKYDDENLIIKELQKGGYVVYLRHHKTRKDQEDIDKKNLKNCKKQRNLSDDGKKESRILGKAFNKLRIKVSKVISSPYCRCVDTAKLAFKRVTINDDLHFSIGVDKTERKRRADSLYRMLQTPPKKGENTVIVSHTANLKESVNIWPKPEGVIHVFQPREKLPPLYIGKIEPKKWGTLL